ncbi:conserved hypothetical protein [uncultured Defluviicoccus sp.]|uniref:Uncharacterized protein n=1 Tax=metagenome TaxID=256318 RepID=A0A380TDY1_9ZZZZ|nr:conserved hypothetical protein [uncultured Defluviicoccus sp.]
MNLEYEAIISWSADDRAFLAEAPERPGWMRPPPIHQFFLAGQVITSHG